MKTHKDKQKPESTQTPANEVVALQAQIDEVQQKYARAVADYQNLEKRMRHQQSQYLQLANVAILTRFLKIFDDLSRAAAHIKDPGLDIILSQFKKSLEEENVTEIEVLDKTFNPAEMECLDQTPGEKDKVIKIVTPGYKLNDHLIRPAQVIVGNGQES